MSMPMSRGVKPPGVDFACHTCYGRHRRTACRRSAKDSSNTQSDSGCVFRHGSHTPVYESPWTCPFTFRLIAAWAMHMACHDKTRLSGHSHPLLVMKIAILVRRRCVYGHGLHVDVCHGRHVCVSFPAPPSPHACGYQASYNPIQPKPTESHSRA